MILAGWGFAGLVTDVGKVPDDVEEVGQGSGACLLAPHYPILSFNHRSYWPENDAFVGKVLDGFRHEG